MRDVTQLFASCREAGRHLWNTTFRGNATGREADWDDRDAFSRVLSALFSALVFMPLGEPDLEIAALWDGVPQPLRRFRVEPFGTRVPILINRTSPPSGYWDDPVKEIAPGDAQMAFVRFFDWDEIGSRDFKFVELQILDFPAQPQLTGRYALLEFNYARIFFVDAP